MTRRRPLLLSVAALLIALAVGVWLVWPASSGVITRENFEKIQVGMTVADVDTLLGQKADMMQAGNPKAGGPAKAGEETHMWASPWDGVIFVDAQDGRVTDKAFQPATEMPFTQRIGIWLALR